MEKEIKKIVELIQEKKELENRYGSVSCFDVPDKYERMDDLHSEALKIAESLSKETEYLLEGRFPERLFQAGDIVESASDIINFMDEYGLNLSDIELDCRSFNEWYEENVNPENNETIDSLFFFMDIHDRKSYLMKNTVYSEDSVIPVSDKFVISIFPEF